MERSLVELESIVRNRICNVCTERTVDGQCGLEEPSDCALFRLFPQVAQAIQSVHSDDIQQYIDAIRRNVCAVCADQGQRRILRDATAGAVRAGRLFAVGGGCHRGSHRENI